LLKDKFTFLKHLYSSELKGPYGLATSGKMEQGWILVNEEVMSLIPVADDSMMEMEIVLCSRLWKVWATSA
jgi:hypothetical protein